MSQSADNSMNAPALPISGIGLAVDGIFWVPELLGSAGVELDVVTGVELDGLVGVTSAAL
ncbi:MAG: hypothetical protein ACHQ52_03140 [Candidatus Eisenbacteria bacterium]